ncbi:MAG: SpoIIE family protein phosphatase, partial [Spirochaetales bacterium]|nr:SpoIIE family protein phosphatase [Spirochaetales bacterium]
NGRFMVTPREDLIMSKTVDEVVGQLADSTSFKALNTAMSAGKTGETKVSISGEKNHVYYAPVERTGWSMCIIIPDSDIYGSIKKTYSLIILLQIFGLLILALILRSFVKNLLRNNELHEREKRMEGELLIASKIQMSMVPDSFLPFPERHDLDMAATIVPAKEVGGDLYDFFIKDEKLFFCIGDVSGKGVPASLVMAVTRTTFRTISAQEDSPEKIVAAMNNSLTDMNENEMFVTFFCGTLDMNTGHLRYCNAGHNPPIALTDRILVLPAVPNLPLGIVPGMKFVGQEMDLHYDDALFLYTDGLTEAENINQEQFGESRMEAALHGRKSAGDHLKDMEEKVKEFVGNAPQSDDLTMLFIHYIGSGKEYHLTMSNDIHQISLLAGFIDRIAEENDLDPSLAMSLNLAIEEAATNAIMYAYPKGTEGNIELGAVAEEGGRLVFTLADKGKPFDPTKIPEADISAPVEDRPIGGLGIHLVRNIMDSISYKRLEGKNVLTMIKNI